MNNNKNKEARRKFEEKKRVYEEKKRAYEDAQRSLTRLEDELSREEDRDEAEYTKKFNFIILQRSSGNVTQEFINPRLTTINRKLTDGQNTMNRLSLEIMVFQRRLMGQKRLRDSF
jgi:hypothetical protein